MDVAKRFALLSSARRLQVGAIIVKDDRIISIGYNGMPSGWSNECEDLLEGYDSRDFNTPDCTYDETTKKWSKLKTKDEVIHAEANAIAKLAKSTESGANSTMFLTHAPCIHCAKQIYTAGVKIVYYEKSYRDDGGIQFLRKCGIEVYKVEKV